VVDPGGFVHRTADPPSESDRERSGRYEIANQLAERGVHFSPQTLTPADQKNVLGSVIHQKFKKAEAALCRSGKLQITGMARQFWKDGGK
jgi:hypothetical protein